MSDWVPASLHAIQSEIGTVQNVPVRLRFEPFGRPQIGLPGAGRNRILYAEAHFARVLGDDDRPSIWFEAGGVTYVLTPGARFHSDWELADRFPEEATLQDLGLVLGREQSDGGFAPVGVGVEVAMCE